MRALNPYSGEVLSELEPAGDSAIQAALQRGVSAFESWRRSSSHDRSRLLEGVAAQLEARTEEFAALIRDEAGKPVTLAKGEVARAVGVFRWAAAEAQRFSGELLRIDTSGTGRPGYGINTRFPRGLILGITPFNFPLNLVAHKVAPAIACGCSILIKPSPFTPQTALRLQELIRTVAATLSPALPPDLMQVILTDDAATARLTQAPEVALVSFTGSARVGSLIRRQIPEKPVALELGGNAWTVVTEDAPAANFPAIVKRIMGAAFSYAGQSCISVQNVAISSRIWPEIQELLIKATETVPYGDPTLGAVVCGPVINLSAARRIDSALSGMPRGWERHSSQALHGKAKETLIPPSLLIRPTDSPEDELQHSLIQEEIFAPVVVAGSYERPEEVVKLVNSSRYGLQTGVFTQNWPMIEKLYQELEVGGLVVNDVPTSRYDHQPYGGVKESGHGREGVRYAMEEMTHSKFLALSSVIPL